MSDKDKQCREAYEMSKLTELLKLFDQRDLTYSAFSDEIALLIKPTVFTALNELFGVKQGYSQISWLDINIEMETRSLFLVGIISYHPNTENLPQIIQKLAPVEMSINDNEALSQLQRVLKIGIPLELVFRSSEEIIEFLSVSIQFMEQKMERVPIVKVNAETGELLPSTTKESEAGGGRISKNDFDISSLTKEQVGQLLIFQHSNKGKGTKH